MLFLEGHLLFPTGPTGKKTCFYLYCQVKYSICEVLEKLDDVESWQSHVNKWWQNLSIDTHSNEHL